MADLGLSYTIRQIGRRFASQPFNTRYTVEEVVFDWASDLGGIASKCTDVAAIARACGFAAASNEKKNKVECAVYVIAVDGLPVSKIGISSCPTQRLAELQSAHWANLSLHAVIWFPTRKSETVEQTALAAASEMECRLNGEWVALDADEALELVLKSARHHDAAACDSATWLSNWKRRVDQLRIAKADHVSFTKASNPTTARLRRSA